MQITLPATHITLAWSTCCGLSVALSRKAEYSAAREVSGAPGVARRAAIWGISCMQHGQEGRLSKAIPSALLQACCRRARLWACSPCCSAGYTP